MTVGVAVLTAAGIAVCGFTGWQTLVPQTSPNITDGNLIALVLEQKDGAGWGWVQSDRVIDPAVDDTVVLRFWASTTDPDGASFVLAGPMIKALRTCYGNGTHWDESPVAFDALSSDEQTAVVRFQLYAPSHGLLKADVGNQVMSEEEANLAASEQTYVRVTSASSAPDSRTHSTTSGAKTTVEVDARQFSFACSFEPEAFWRMQQGQRTFTFPTVSETFSFASDTNYAYIDRTVTFVRRPGLSVVSLGDPPDYSNSASTEFRDNWSAWNYREKSTLVLNKEVAVFTATSDDTEHQSQMLVLGTGLAFLGTLVLSLGRRVTDALSRRLAFRRMAGEEPADPCTSG
ncbi:MAG: hypothetical protein JWR04_358 [Rhodoglobus sp.]|nr:hypothetical protein [Rhodoglobus sp.]